MPNLGNTAAAGLYLPTSDIDLVVVNSGCSDIIQGLKAIATSLVRKAMATNIQVIIAFHLHFPSQSSSLQMACSAQINPSVKLPMRGIRLQPTPTPFCPSPVRPEKQGRVNEPTVALLAHGHVRPVLMWVQAHH